MTTKVKVNTTLAEPSQVDQGGHRSIVKAPNGTLWVMYADINWSTADLLVAYSSDGGATWTEEIALDNGILGYLGYQSYGKGAYLLVDSSNVPHVVFLSSSTFGDYLKLIRHLDRTGGSWGSVETIDTCDASNNINSLSVAIDSSDNIHVVAGGTFGGTGGAFYWVGTTGSWSARELINSGGGDVDLAIDGSDKPHCIYFSTSYRYKNRITGSWSAQETVESAGGWSGKIATDSNDDVHIVWNEIFGTNNFVGIKYRKRTSGSWGTEQIVINGDTKGEDSYGYPLLALDTDNNAYVVYQYDENTSFAETVWFKKVTSEVVGSEQTLDSTILQPNTNLSTYTALWHRFPSSGVLAVGSSPTVVLLHEHDQVDGYADVYYESYAYVASTWIPKVFII